MIGLFGKLELGCLSAASIRILDSNIYPTCTSIATMASLQLSSSKVELAARAIDLTVALAHANSASSGLIRGAWEIGQWLGREKLNQYELEDCMRKAKGLVFANQHGETFFNDILRGMETMPIGPLFLQQSGSLGRLMAGDPHLSWIISTTSCLFQFIRDDRIVSDTLIAMIIRGSQQDTGKQITAQFIYSPAQVQIKKVVQKIVSSVWYNVVNSGCDTIPLPPEVKSICERGHLLDIDDFSIVTHAIYTKCKSKAILRTDHLLHDVTLWLLLHYDGLLVVNAGGEIVFQEQLGNSEREIELHIKDRCDKEKPCKEGMGKYEILSDIGGKFEHFLSGYCIGSKTKTTQSGIRQKLYSIPQIAPEESSFWDKGTQSLVKCTAQEIMRWLLDVSLSRPNEDWENICFKALVDETPAAKLERSDRLTIGNLLKRVPAMVNMHWGGAPPAPVVFAKAMNNNFSQSLSTAARGAARSGPAGSSEDPKNSLGSSYRHLSRADGQRKDFSTVVHSFPILLDRLKILQFNCVCPNCSMFSSNDLTSSIPQPGCLKHNAVEEIMLLLAHGIADGFNINDVSSISNPDSIVEGIFNLLHELVHEQKVSWDSWFALAATVYLGCPFTVPEKHYSQDYGGTSFAAFQYGNLAVQAPWLDMNRKLESKGLFEMFGLRGRLGVLAQAYASEDYQFRGIEENFAVIETEDTEDTNIFNSRYKKKFVTPEDWSKAKDTDTSDVSSDVILISTGETHYRLLLRVKTSLHWRIVDPSDAVKKAIKGIEYVVCSHPISKQEILPSKLKLYTFEEALGRWPDMVREMPTSGQDDDKCHEKNYHASYALQTNFKNNILMALTPNYKLLQIDIANTCWDCIQVKLQTSEEVYEAPDVYIIGFNEKLDNSSSSSIVPLRSKDSPIRKNE
jgi:hypothetical protein